MLQGTRVPADTKVMDFQQVRPFRRLLADLRLDQSSEQFARALGSGGEQRDALLVVGTPECEPWHFVAHLSEEAQSAGRPDLVPTWVRWAAPAVSRPHLATSVDRLGSVGRGDTVVVVAPNSTDERLLERVSDAKRSGGRIMTLHREDDEVEQFAHETLVVPALAPGHIFDVVQHAVTSTVAAPLVRLRRRLRR
jgi:hypothetical protein